MDFIKFCLGAAWMFIHVHPCMKCKSRATSPFTFSRRWWWCLNITFSVLSWKPWVSSSVTSVLHDEKTKQKLISFQTLLGLCVSICNSSFWAQAWNWLYPFISLLQRLVKMSLWHIYMIRFLLPSVHSQTHLYGRKQCVIFLHIVFELYSWLERHVIDLYNPFYSSHS